MRLLVLVLSAVVILCMGGCAAKSTDIAGTIEITDLEDLDKELREPWPDLGDVPLTDAERKALETRLEMPYRLSEYAAREIHKEFVFLTRQARGVVNRWLTRSVRIMPHVQRAVAARKLPREIAYLPFIESGFNLKAYSPASAAGLWQFIPGTGRRFGLRSNKWIDERLHLFKSTEAALNYLVFLHDMFGDWSLALAAYNAGEGKISEAVRITQSKDFFELSQRNNMLTGKTQLRRETLEYVPRLLAMSKIYANLKALGFDAADQSRTLDWAVIEVPPGTNIMGLAPASGLDADEFRHFNLAFRRQVAPPGEPSLVHVPAAKAASVQSYIASLPPPTTKVFATASADDEAVGKHASYTVRQGDTLSAIGARNGVSVAALMKANNLKRTDLRPGQKLTIPGGKTAPSSKRSAAQKSETKPEKGGVKPITPLAVTSRSSPTRTAENAPAGGSRISVNKGDTLLALAKRHNTSVDALLQANGLKSPRDLRAGQSLLVPGKDAPAGEVRPRGNEQPLAATAAVKSPSPPGSAKKQAVPATVAENHPPAAGSPAKSAPSLPAERKSGKTPANSSVYTIQSGDTVWAIARKFKVSATDIIAWNNLKKDAILRPGDTLKLMTR